MAAAVHHLAKTLNKLATELKTFQQKHSPTPLQKLIEEIKDCAQSECPCCNPLQYAAFPITSRPTNFYAWYSERSARSSRAKPVILANGKSARFTCLTSCPVHHSTLFDDIQLVGQIKS